MDRGLTSRFPTSPPAAVRAALAPAQACGRGRHLIVKAVVGREEPHDEPSARKSAGSNAQAKSSANGDVHEPGARLRAVTGLAGQLGNPSSTMRSTSPRMTPWPLSGSTRSLRGHAIHPPRVTATRAPWHDRCEPAGFWSVCAGGTNAGELDAESRRTAPLPTHLLRTRGPGERPYREPWTFRDSFC
jgi:hypothetical protein